MEEEPKRLKVTPDEFRILIKGGKVNLSQEGGIEFSGYLIEEEDGAGFNTVVLKNIEIPIASIAEGDTLKIQLSGNSKIGKISVVSDAWIKELSISGNADVREIEISQRAKIESLEISSHGSVGSVAVKNSAHIKYFWMFTAGVLNQLKVFNEAVIGDLILSARAKLGYLIIENESSVGYFNMYENSEVDELIVRDESKVGDVFLEGESCLSKIYFNDKADVGSVLLSGSANVNELTVDDQVELRSFVVTDSSKILQVNFFGGSIKEKVLFYDLRTKSICFSGYGTKLPSKFLINQISCHSLRFVNCHISTSVQIADLNTIHINNGFIEFTRASFQRLELVANRFDLFRFIAFCDSDIANAFIANTKFPKEIKVLKFDEIFYYESSVLQSKLFAEQLKIVHQQQGNRSEALKYQAKELEAHYQELSWESHAWDKATLAFNKYTTNFGISWVRGLGALFLVSFVLYALLLLFSWPSIGVIKDWEKWSSEFIEFINPASHIWKKWDFLYELTGKDNNGNQIEPNVFVKFWLLFSKVVIVTMIYQIVQAFRKFGKR